MSTSVLGLSSNFFPSAQNGFTTTTSGSVGSGAATVGLNSVAGYTNGEIVVFVIDPTDVSKKQTFTGVMDTSGSQVTSVKWTAGTNQTHALGATVVDYATATHISMITKGLLAAGLNQTGTITPKVATSINDTSGNEVIKTPATASAVNEITVTNAATGVAPSISATGTDSAINLNLRGKGLAKTVTIGAGATPIYQFDYVHSGCVWSGDAYGSTRVASMTAGVVVINGNPVTVAAVTSRTFTASKDVYVDVLDNGDGTGLLVYTDGTTNAASGALAANSVRLAIIVVGASSIAAATSVNQGQETMVLPIASSIPYAVTDSLGNLICPRDPNRKVLGYRQRVSDFTSTGTNTAITELSVPVIVPENRKVKLVFYAKNWRHTVAVTNMTVSIWDGAIAGTEVGRLFSTIPGASYSLPCSLDTQPSSLSAGLHTFNASFTGSAATGTIEGGATYPIHLRVELA